MPLKMKTFIAVIACASCTVLSTVYAANNFDESIKNATTSGQFRFGYITVDPDVAGAKSTTGAAFGGHIKFETEKWHATQFAIAPYFSERLSILSGDSSKNELNGEFFDANNQSFAYLGEAYVNYAFTNGTIRFGRQQLDNPFINTDDSRMHPNTFSAAWFNMNLTDRLVLDAGVVTEMAGFDSGVNTFTKASNNGVTALGVTYQMKAHHTFQGWYYNFDGQYSQYYLDAAYQNGPFNAGMQYSSYNEVNNSNIAGSVWGIKANYTISSITLGLALNGSTNGIGKSQSLGLGEGNYFSSMDESKIGGLSKATATVFTADYAATENLSIGLAHGQFADRNKATTNISETNLSFAYKVNEKLEIEFVHASVDNKATPADTDTNFSRNFARVNYNF